MENNKSFRKFHREWLWAFVPVFLGLGIVFVFSTIELIEFEFSVKDVDTFVLLFGLMTTTTITTVLVTRESSRRLQQITEQQLRQQYAEENARFLSRLDHEIKNPLMGIKTALDNLADIDNPDDRHRIRLAIYGQIDRLTRLVTDLRKVGDLDQRHIESLPIDSRMLIEDAFNIVLEDEQVRHRQTILALPDDLPTIYGDYDLLLLAIYNVLNNAFKYTEDNDIVQLSATVAEDDISISVKDNGPGINPTDLTHIWEELYRSQSVKHLPGSGIGLALVRRIIERHGGRNTIESQVNQGTTVTIYLPLHVTD